MKNLNEVLQKNDFPEIKIQEIILLKLGCITYSAESDKRFEKDSQLIDKAPDIIKVEFDENGFIIPTSLLSCLSKILEKHQNIFDLSIQESEDLRVTRINQYIFVSGADIKLKIKIPKRFQKYSKQKFKSTKVVEIFDVLSIGSIFIAYANVEDIYVKTYIAHEFREIFQKQINTYSNIFSNTLGPCPINPNIYIAYYQGAQDEEPSFRITPIGKGDLLFVADNRFTKEDIIKHIITNVNHLITIYYKLSAIRSEILFRNITLYELFKEIASNVIERTNIKWCKPWKIRKYSTNAKNALLKSHLLLVRIDELIMEHSKLRELFLSELKDNTILSYISEYFIDHSKKDFDLPESINTSINHFEKEIHLYSNLNVIIISSIIGAIIGSLLTFLLTILN